MITPHLAGLTVFTPSFTIQLAQLWGTGLARQLDLHSHANSSQQTWSYDVLVSLSTEPISVLLEKLLAATIMVKVRWQRPVREAICLKKGRVSLLGPSWKYSKLVKYWCFGMAANQTYNPKASALDELGMRLIDQLSHNLDLSANEGTESFSWWKRRFLHFS